MIVAKPRDDGPGDLVPHDDWSRLPGSPLLRHHPLLPLPGHQDQGQAIGGKLASQVDKVNSEGEKGSAERRDWMLETVLFSWVLLTALIFNLVYWTKQRG